MRTLTDIKAELTDPGIIAVVRTEHPGQVPKICRALLDGGVVAIEITFTVPGALEAIRAASREFGTEALLGAGTVLDVATCRNAIDAGAEFVVSPIVRLELVAAAHAAGKPVMLGAYTPTEAQAAHEAGADFIKIFPADKLGPSYIKALRAPLPHLRIVPTGGVDLNTAADFLKAGCAALGVGGSLLSAQILKTEDWPALTQLAREYVQIVRAFRASA